MEFFTATVNNWQKLLAQDKYKQLLLDSLKWMRNEKRVEIHGFVIMPNHFHLLWSANENFTSSENETTLLRYTAHMIQKDLIQSHPNVLPNFASTQNDRKYQFWERRSRTIEVKSREIALQKLIYIHNNPLQDKWRLVELPEQYYFSSARFYLDHADDFGILTHYIDFI
jgi:putative transposase